MTFVGRQAYDFVEVCAGHARLSRVVAFGGFQVASLDIAYWQNYVENRPARSVSSTRNPLDMMSPAGMARFGTHGVIC